jgi:hypothetical protein
MSVDNCLVNQSRCWFDGKAGVGSVGSGSVGSTGEL